MLDVASHQPVEIGDLVDVLELVEDDERPVAAAFLQPQRKREQRMEGRQRSELRVELQPRADAERTEREADAGLLQEVLDPRSNRALQLPGVRALEPDRDVGQGDDPIEIDEDGNQPLPLLALLQRPSEQARLAVLARCVETHVVASHDTAKQLLRLAVSIDDVLRRHRAGVHEGIHIADHDRPRDYQIVV